MCVWGGGGGSIIFSVIESGITLSPRLIVRSQLVSVDFFVDIKSFRLHYGPGVDSASNRNEYQ